MVTLRLELLNQIIAVNKHGSISKAANELFISRSALSTSISQLEEELNVSLFVRTPNGISPTKAGKEILVQAKKVVDIMDEIYQIGRNNMPINYEISGNISFGIREKFVNSILNSAIIDTNNKYPNITFSAINMDAETCINALCKGEIQFGFVAFPVEDKDSLLSIAKEKQLSFIPLHSDQAYVIINPDCPLSSRKSIVIEDIFNYTFVTFDNTEKFLPALEDISSKQYFKNKVIYMPNLDSSLNYIMEKENFFTLLPSAFFARIQNHLNNGTLRAIPLENSQQHNYIVFLNTSNLSECCTYFMNTYKHQFSEMFR